jgi:hypothetical protein
MTLRAVIGRHADVSTLLCDQVTTRWLCDANAANLSRSLSSLANSNFARERQRIA